MATAFDSAFSGAPMPTYDEKAEEVVADDVELEEEPQAPEVDPEKPVEPKEPEAPPAKEPPPVEPETKVVPHQALHQVREELKAARAEIQRMQQTQAKPPTSVLEDEDKAFQERINPALADVRRQLLEFSVEVAKQKPGREDYDEIYAFMNSACVANPSLAEPIINSKNPGETIYQLGKTRKELAEVGNDLSKYREHVTKQERERTVAAEARIKALETEIATMKASAIKQAAIPRSLNAETSGAVKPEEFSGPTPLKKVFS